MNSQSSAVYYTIRADISSSLALFCTSAYLFGKIIYSCIVIPGISFYCLYWLRLAPANRKIQPLNRLQALQKAKPIIKKPMS